MSNIERYKKFIKLEESSPVVLRQVESKPMPQIINEFTKSRLVNDVKSKHIAVISSQRGDLSPQENDARHAQMKADLQARGHAWVDVMGAYDEDDGKSGKRTVKERSFYVKSDDYDRLKRDMVELGGKYNQDSVLIKHKDEDQAHLHGTKEGAWPGIGVKEPIGQFHPEAGDAQFYSMFRNRRKMKTAFKNESVDEPNPECRSLVFTIQRTFLNRGRPEHNGPEYV